MKSHLVKTCILIALSLVTLRAENLVVNGDFEAGEGNAFYQTKPWYNAGTGLNQGANARNEDGAVIMGSYSATVIDRYNSTEGKPGPIAYVQKTGHIIREGDSFALSYEWRPGNDYWQRSTDAIRFVLFTTSDEKLGGAKVWSSELTSDFSIGNADAIMSVNQTTDVVNEDAVGRPLFVMFYGVDTVDSESGEPHWARVDSIEVKVLNETAP